MLGKILGIDENQVLLKINLDLEKYPSLIGNHVIMEDTQRRCVGEITDIKEGIAYINLLGEIKNNKFVYGVITKPSFGAVTKVISKERIPLIISADNYEEDKHLTLGKSAIYEDVDINVDINNFFANHFAIFGSTGSGKSCSVARIFQNLFEKDNSIPYKASIFIFDAYGEYHQAFNKLHDNHPNINFKSYTTNTRFPDLDILKIPPWLLSVDDYALLLGVEKASQISIIEKSLRFVSIFVKEEQEVIKYKNDIISRALLDILSSGKSSSQIRDQLMSVLTNYNTSELNLETPVYQPGYTRPLKQLFFIDASGKIREMETLTTFFESFLTDKVELSLPDGTFKYTLDDLAHAFDFALISEGVLLSNKVFDDANIIKVRLHSLINSEYKVYFECNEFMSKDTFIRSLLTANDNRKAQIINFNINYVDDRFAKCVTKIFAKLLFDYAKEQKNRGALPFHIILEEAHRYVQNDNDINIIGYNIFDRITKEGRKYGVMLGLISQRPSELSETSLSQCNNFLIFKMLHPRDIEYIKQIVPNITNEIVKRLKILQPGTCVAFGNGFKVPVIIKFELPNPTPSSDSCNISKTWFVNRPSS
ncbi:MAG: ATP-binding protein [Bacilli bacterium]|nr:ATP-binding protein [Bacilli bacterium]